MKQQLHFITLGVDDLPKMSAWYKEKFGWETLKDSDEIVFFKLNGLILSLFPADELAKDAAIEQNEQGFKKFTLAVCLSSEEEVDRTFEALEKEGVHIVKAPAKAFWGGYSGYIADPENNYWEIAYNPFLELDNNGNVITHK